MNPTFVPVILESPYAGEVEINTLYARQAMRDCLMRGEAPYASHMLYTQPGVLDDLVPEERDRGINAGFAFRQLVRRTVVYVDRGVSAGMWLGIKNAHERKCVVTFRSIAATTEERTAATTAAINEYKNRLRKWTSK